MDAFENLKINFFNEVEFETQAGVVTPTPAISGRILLTVARAGTCVKDRPASAETGGYAVWSVPSSLVNLINRINFGTPEHHIAQVLSGSLNEASLKPEQDAIDRGLAVIRRLRRKKPVLVLQNPEITIRLLDVDFSPTGKYNDSPYVITAALKPTIKYLNILTPADIVRLVKTPVATVRSDMRATCVEAVFIDGTVYVKPRPWSTFPIKYVFEMLEIPKRTPRDDLTYEACEVIYKAVSKHVPVSAVLALSS
ncbi:MAG: hypothetical protein JRN66_06955 [Nitrososphaerota archaeon]|nr:hypothetical protein [Nitrososphaerota archaeon]